MEDTLCYIKLKKCRIAYMIFYCMFFTHIMTYIKMLVEQRISLEGCVSKWMTVVVSKEK